MPRQTSPLSDNTGKEDSLQSTVMKLRVRLEQQQKKYAKLKIQHNECLRSLDQAIYENQQLEDAQKQSKLFFEEYHQNVQQTLAQIESENSELKSKLTDVANLQLQIDS